MNNFRTTRAAPKSVELHIEELVLHGFPPGDRYAIADAVQSELSQLFADQLAAQGMPPSFAQNPGRERLDAGAFEVSTGWTSKSVGHQIAQNVHQGLSK